MGVGGAARKTPLPNPPPQGGREALYPFSLHTVANVLRAVANVAGDRSYFGGRAGLCPTNPATSRAVR